MTAALPLPDIRYREALRRASFGDSDLALKVFAVTDLLDALGFKAMAREAASVTDNATLKRYANVIVGSSNGEWRERAERLLGRLGLR